jgi:hypothetical protein
VLTVVTLRNARRRPAHALWSITAACLLLAPIAWNNYLVLLAPSVPMLLARGRWRDRGGADGSAGHRDRVVAAVRAVHRLGGHPVRHVTLLRHAGVPLGPR